jgi:two-component system, OmpR family, phosphate regulon sensor histidine kinase PhoR
MNKRTIVIIIGLMIAALIGVTWIQFDFINKSIKINVDQFDRNVHDALVQVSKKLEKEETYALQADINGYNFNKFRKESKSDNTQDSNTNIKDESWLETRFKQMLYINPISERINIEHLDTYIREELLGNTINIPFNYGVFSRKEKSFVILNNHYVVANTQAPIIQKGVDNLYNSNHKVYLYPSDLISPGLLMVYFPTKNSFVWGALWQTMLLSLLFTALILGCFIYTIYIILQQKKLSEMKNDFINNMTHEFKTPIATISLATDSILNPKIIENSEKITKFIGIIKQENKRMNSQVEKVLQMALLDKSEYKLNISEIDIHETIEQAVANIMMQVEKREGIVTMHLDASHYKLEGDITHIASIVNNLLDNANKYSSQNPTITVKTRNNNDGIFIDIEDKGIGLSKESMKHVFEKFYRVPTGNLHEVKGFGLGLAYVHTMMQAHNGTITMKSELGKGSCFTLFLPFKHQKN